MKIPIGSASFSLVIFLGFPNLASAQAPCPAPPSVTLPEITHSSSNQTLNFTLNVPPYSNANTTEGRYPTVYKKPFGTERDVSIDSNGNPILWSHVISYNLEPVSATPGGAPSPIGATVNFGSYQGFPNWDGTNGINMPYAQFTQSISPKTGSTATFAIKIPGNQNVPTGRYRITFPVYVAYYTNSLSHCGSYQIPGAMVAWNTASFIYNKPASLSLNISGGGSNGTISFDGTNGLKSGETKIANLNINSGSAYKITFDSLNNGFLKNQTQGFENETVTYSAKFDNQPISESTPFNSSSSTSGTVSKSFEVTIGNTDNARAGYYKDIIYLNISPLGP